MTIRIRPRLLRAAATAALAALALPALAADAWKPTTHVEYFVPAGPGGAVDTYGRIMAKIMEEQHLLEGQQLIIQNKPGGSGMMATGELVKRPGNGHYFTLFNTGYIISSELGEFRYDLRKDFTQGPLLYSESMGIAVAYDSPLTSARELLEALRKDPASLRLGVAPSLNGNIYMSAVYPLLQAGIEVDELTIAPFRSSAETLVALRGGHIDVMASSVANVLDAVANKQVRVLAVTSPQRLTGALADVPTWKEQGVDISFMSYNGFMFPPGLNDAQKAYWEKVFRAVSDSAEWQATLERFQLQPAYIEHGAVGAFIDRQFDETRTLMRKLNLIKDDAQPAA